MTSNTKIMIGITSTPNLTIKNITRFFVEQLNVRHLTAHQTPLDLRTDLLLWGKDTKANKMFNGMMISNINTNEDAEIIRNTGGIMLHILPENSLLKTGVTQHFNDLVIKKCPLNEPTQLTLAEYVAAINAHFHCTDKEAD